MAFDFPSSPTLNQQFTPSGGRTYVWNGYAWDPVGVSVAGTGGSTLGGRLTLVSGTQLKFSPFNGNLIKINGSLFTIPVAGIAGLANTSVFVNGTAAQNLAASTLYYVYAFSNAGVVTADFSTTGHATSTTAGNEGTEIKSGDDTRTLIGLINTTSASPGQFSDTATARYVLSWLNRRNLAVTGAGAGGATSASASVVEIVSTLRAFFLNWADEMVLAGTNGQISNNTTNSVTYSACTSDIGLLGAVVAYTPHLSGQAAQGNGTTSYSLAFGEGSHWVSPAGGCAAGGTGVYNTNAWAMIRG
jgi:hypothetical protein